MRASSLLLVLVPAVAGAQAATQVASSGGAAPSASGTARRAAIPVAAVMSAPFASEIEGTPSGRFAWIVAQQGARSVYVADAATRTATRVAHWAQDDGQDLTDLSLSRDGRTVAFVRGQPFNRIRENPNPTSDPAGAEQAVWVSVGGAPPRKLGWGAAPRVAPNGRLVVFQRDSTLMVADLTAMPVTARPLFRARGVNQDAKWSPDGARVAFTSNRGTHSFVGVYDIARRTITWIAPSIDRDANPTWSPDGRRLLFTRSTAGAPIGVSLMAPAGNTFAFHIADPDAGTARPLWRSAARARLGAPGMEQTLQWVGDRILFSAELDGWHHLYALDADTATTASPTPRALTSGKCEVDGAAVVANGATVYASTNCVTTDTADVDRKHLWKIDVAMGQGTMITPGYHIEFAPVAAGSAIAYLESEPHLPAMARVLDAAGKKLDVAGGPKAPATYPAHDALVMPQQVVFRSADGTPVHGQLFMPPGAQAGAKRPAVIFMHGGPVRQMLLGFAPRGYYSNAYAFNQHLASKGYVVLSVNYRGGIGYGREFREPAKLGARGAIEYEDVVAGAKYLQARPEVDGEKIGLWGGSYGGYLTALGMGRNPELFKAGVDLHGVHDWFAHYRQMGRPVNVPPGAAGDSVTRVAREASPVCCVQNIRGPLLLVHGDDDRNVPFEQTTSFAELLRRHDKPFELLVLPDEVHGFLRHASWVRVFEVSSDFLDRKLAGTVATAAR